MLSTAINLRPSGEGYTNKHSGVPPRTKCDVKTICESVEGGQRSKASREEAHNVYQGLKEDERTTGDLGGEKDWG